MLWKATIRLFINLVHYDTIKPSCHNDWNVHTGSRRSETMTSEFHLHNNITFANTG